MKTVSMSGSLRENVGKKDAKHLRAEGLVPCVVYGGGKQYHFAVEEKQFIPVVYTPEVCFIEINLGEQKINAILQDTQFHPVEDNIIHADFLEIIEGRELKMSVPVKVVGVSPGVLKGGKLKQRLKKLAVKALPEFIPEFIEADITSLEIGQAIKVDQMEKENVVFLDSKAAQIVGVVASRNIAAEEEEEAAAAAAATTETATEE